jgi:hypothetical protein
MREILVIGLETSQPKGDWKSDSGATLAQPSTMM